MVMMTISMKGDQSLGNWAPTVCVQGCTLDPRCCHCCCCCQPRHFYFVVFVFVGIFIPLSSGMIRACLLSAELAMNSGAWPWSGAWLSQNVCCVTPVLIGVGGYSAPPAGQYICFL